MLFRVILLLASCSKNGQVSQVSDDSTDASSSSKSFSSKMLFYVDSVKAGVPKGVSYPRPYMGQLYVYEGTLLFEETSNHTGDIIISLTHKVYEEAPVAHTFSVSIRDVDFLKDNEGITVYGNSKLGECVIKRERPEYPKGEWIKERLEYESVSVSGSLVEGEKGNVVITGNVFGIPFSLDISSALANRDCVTPSFPTEFVEVDRASQCYVTFFNDTEQDVSLVFAGEQALIIKAGESLAKWTDEIMVHNLEKKLFFGNGEDYSFRDFDSSSLFVKTKSERQRFLCCDPNGWIGIDGFGRIDYSIILP